MTVAVSPGVAVMVVVVVPTPVHVSVVVTVGIGTRISTVGPSSPVLVLVRVTEPV